MLPDALPSAEVAAPVKAVAPEASPEPRPASLISTSPRPVAPAAELAEPAAPTQTPTRIQPQLLPATAPPSEPPANHTHRVTTTYKHEPVSSRAWRALAVASLGTILVGFNSTASNIAFDDIRDGFTGATTTEVGWGLALYFIGTAAFLPLGGRLADRLGRRRIFLAGLALFGLSAVLSAVAPTVWTLNIARTLQAIAGAAVLPASLSLVLPLFPQSRRTTAIGLWSAAGPLAAGIAPTASAFLLAASSWRVVYFVSAPVALVMLLVSFRVLAEQPTQTTKHRLDIIGVVAGTMAIGAVVTAIFQGDDWGFTSPIVLGLAAAGVLALVLFVRSSLRHPAPLLNLHLLRRRGVWVPNLANFLVSISSQSLWLVWPLLMLNVWGFSKTTVGVAVTLGPVAAGVSTVIFSRLGDRVSQAWLCRIGSALQIASIFWQLSRIEAEPNYWGVLAPAITLYGIGWGMSTPLLNSLALRWVEESHFGEINGLFNTMRYAAAAIGTAGLFALLQVDSGPEAVMYYRHVLIFFMCSASAAFLSLWIPTRIRNKARKT